ncbi:MAG: protein kinase [Anaerolineae bacterium]|nr:protein kinase [Anaerolineae bacterium]
MPLSKDSILKDRYRILEVLGQGGMGSVYRVTDENLGVEVAVKENLYTTDEYSRQFRLEATILASMRHPNLPRVFDHFEIEDQGQYLVMDYIEGEDLRERMDRAGILPDEEVLVIGAAICDALGFLHSRNPAILHRDIKPGNIKINPEGEVYLVDFGLAKVVEGSQATTTGARAMTPGYSSPEQYGTARTDARSDVYSLGATLYAALTSTIPEDGLARAMDQVGLTPIRKRNPKVSRKTAKVIEKSLAIFPDDRYQSAIEYKESLLDASSATKNLKETGEYTISPPPKKTKAKLPPKKTPIRPPTPVDGIEAAYPPPPKGRRRRRGRGFRSMVVTIGVGSVLAVGALFGYLLTTGSMPEIWQIYNPSDSTESSRTSTPSLEAMTAAASTAKTETAAVPSATAPAPATEEISPTPTPDNAAAETPPVTGTPSGGGSGQIAFSSDRTGIPQIWIINSDGTALFRLTNLPEGACQPVWSPDGTQIAFISPCEENRSIYMQASIYLMNADGSGITPLQTGTGSFDPAWSPDGNSLLFTRAFDINRTQILRVDLVDQSVHLLTDNQQLNYHANWSPDGSRFVYSSTRLGGQAIWIQLNDPDVEPILLTRSGTKVNSAPSWSPDGELIIFSQRSESGGVPSLIITQFSMAGVDITEYVEERMSDGVVIPEDEADFSPDNFWIAFESWPAGGNHDLFIYNHIDRILVQLTFDSALDFDPAWRPSWQ